MIQRLRGWLLHRGLDLVSTPLTLTLSEQFALAEALRNRLIIELSEYMSERVGLCPRGKLVELYASLSQAERALQRLREELATQADEQLRERGGSVDRRSST